MPKSKRIDVGEMENSYVSPDRLLELTRPHIVRQQLVNHRRRDGSDTFMELFKCRECEYSRRQEAAVVQHIAAQHMNVWTIRCRLCGQLERTAARMEQHLNTRHQRTREVDKAATGSYRLVTSDECTVDIVPESFR
jgi:hypothetical protein